MTDLLFLGWDISTTGCGAVLLSSDGAVLRSWIWQNETDHVDERIYFIGQWAREIFIACEYSFLSCSIEDGFVRGSSSLNLAEARGAVKAAYRSQWSRFSPSEVKATARAHHPDRAINGKATLQVAVTALLPPQDVLGFVTQAGGTPDPEKAMGDVCDAFWVARRDYEIHQFNTARQEAIHADDN